MGHPRRRPIRLPSLPLSPVSRVTSRREARLVICPVCNAYPGEKCWKATDEAVMLGARLPMEACHPQRHERAIALGAKPIHFKAPRT